MTIFIVYELNTNNDASPSNSPTEEADMGKGDRRSKRGKIWRSTYGAYRPKKKKTDGDKAKS